MDKKKIIIIDDEPLIPVLMKEVVEEDPRLEISRIVSQKEEFLHLIGQESFDAALVDISVGGRQGGFELLQALKDKSIELPVVMVSAYDELQYALKCLQAGARGYINKKYICTDVVRCLWQILNGDLFVSGDRGESIIHQYKKSFVPSASSRSI